jgi:hypothetical protein
MRRSTIIDVGIVFKDAVAEMVLAQELPARFNSEE